MVVKYISIRRATIFLTGTEIGMNAHRLFPCGGTTLERVGGIKTCHAFASQASIIILKSHNSRLIQLQEKAVCQDEWRFAMSNRDKALVEYKELMKKAASES